MKNPPAFDSMMDSTQYTTYTMITLFLLLFYTNQNTEWCTIIPENTFKFLKLTVGFFFFLVWIIHTPSLYLLVRDIIRQMLSSYLPTLVCHAAVLPGYKITKITFIH